MIGNISIKSTLITGAIALAVGFGAGNDWAQGRQAKKENEQIKQLNEDIIYYQERVKNADEKLQEAKRAIANGGERVITRYVERVRNLSPTCLSQTAADSGNASSTATASVEQDRQRLERIVRDFGALGVECDTNAELHNATIKSIGE